MRPIGPDKHASFLNAAASRIETCSAFLLQFSLTVAVSFLRPLFHDEASTYYGCAFGMDRLWQYLDIHPPLFFLMAAGYFEIGGANLLGLRIVSAVCMSAGSYIFAHACARLFGQTRPSRALLWFCATSPFLIFAGSFARYYGLITLLAAVGFDVAVKFRSSPLPRYAFALGISGALLLLTNYPAALLLLPVMLFLVIRHGRIKSLIIFAAPVSLAALTLVPLLLHQWTEFAAATSSQGLGQFLKQVVLSGAYLFYCLGLGDALPPWTPIGLVTAIGLCSLFAVGLIHGLRSAPRLRNLAFLVVLLVDAGAIIGALLLPGARMLFLPPRMPYLFFMLALLIIGIPAAASKLRTWQVVLAVGINLTGLAPLLFSNHTTVWAYRLPLNDISRTIKVWLEEFDGNQEKPSIPFYLPSASFANVRFHLEQEKLPISINPITVPEDSRMAFVLSETRGETSTPLELREPSNETTTSAWVRERTAFLLPEDKIAMRLKKQIMHRDAQPYKLSLKLYLKADN